jgi:ribose transport system permease protein
MTDSTTTSSDRGGVGGAGSDQGPGPAGASAAPDVREPVGRRLRRLLSFRNISAIYIFVAMFILFALWVPGTFLTSQTWRSILSQQALTALAAIALVIPLAAGTFNLAVGAEVGFGAILVAWLISKGVAPAAAIAMTMAAGMVVGIVNGLLIVRVKIDSFIATLGMSSVLLALIEWLSGNTQILNLPSNFQNIATNELFGVTYPVYFMLVVALVVWYVLEKTPAGRRVYATGGNIDAARLAGVGTQRVIVGAFVTGGVIAATTGWLASSQLAVGDPTIGPPYLLPAFAAAFLGSTQFRGGRYNVWGTVVAVYVLAVGVKGLQLAGAPVWIPDLFNGVALLVAVGMARFQGSSRRTAAIRRLVMRGRPNSTAAVGE